MIIPQNCKESRTGELRSIYTAIVAEMDVHWTPESSVQDSIISVNFGMFFTAVHL